MISINYDTSQLGTEGRKRLAFALQGAYSCRQYNSPALSDAIRDFVRGARHCGLTLDWVLTAVQDVINTGILPSLGDSNRLAFSKPILRLAAEAYRCSQDPPRWVSPREQTVSQRRVLDQLRMLARGQNSTADTRP